MSQSIEVDKATHRKLAVNLFNYVWTLIEKEAPTVEEKDAMIHAAHASRHHWGIAGGPTEWGRGEWQISRVYAVLGFSDAALRHGERYLELVEAHELSDFDRAYAHEALARGLSLRGQCSHARAHLGSAMELLDKLDDAEDREYLSQDLGTIAI